MSERTVRLKDVAHEAGVSVSTVSKALHNSPLVPDEKKKRIQKIASRLGYIPNPMAVALRSRQSAGAFKGNLGFIVGHFMKNPLPLHKTYQLVYEGAEERCRRRGYSLECFWAYDPQYVGPKLGNVLQARNIQGLLLLSIHENELQVDLSGFAVSYCSLLIQEYRGELSHPYATVDVYNMARDAFRRASEAGFRKAGLVVEEGFDRSCHGAAGAAALAAAPISKSLEIIPSLITSGSNRDENIMEWFRQYQPDVVISALGNKEVSPIFRKNGIRVPEDVSCLSLTLISDETQEAGYHWPHKNLGQAAVDLVVSAIAMGEIGETRQDRGTIVPARFTSGKTFVALQ